MRKFRTMRGQPHPEDEDTEDQKQEEEDAEESDAEKPSATPGAPKLTSDQDEATRQAVEQFEVEQRLARLEERERDRSLNDGQVGLFFSCTDFEDNAAGGTRAAPGELDDPFGERNGSKDVSKEEMLF